MSNYDPTLEALMAQMRGVLVPHQEALPQNYIDTLRAVQAALVAALAKATTDAASPEEDQTMRQALSRLDAKTGDQSLGYGEVLRRVLSAVDKELMKWTSGLVQPIGPSGDAVTPPVIVAPAPPVARR
jgi:hypothetical protein